MDQQKEAGERADGDVVSLESAYGRPIFSVLPIHVVHVYMHMYAYGLACV